MTISKMLVAMLSLYSILLLIASFYVDPSNEVYRLISYYDTMLCVLFAVDFFRDLKAAENKLKYFFTIGWLDLLSSIPVIHELRFARLFKLVRIIRVVKSIKLLIDFMKSDKRQSVYAIILLMITLSIIVTSASVLHVEQHAASSNIKTAEDALWWTFITVTTVGYGDYYPVTNTGKVIASILILMGLIGFGSLITYLNGRLDSLKN
jgi:voltage-gated potassium channel